MNETNTLARILHDGGLAAWFGGSLFGAAALNPASREASNGADALRVANDAWGRWTRWNLAAIGAHLVGGAAITYGNKGRLLAQQGVGSSATAKTGLTVAALAASAYARRLGQEITDYEEAERQYGSVAAEGATTPAPETPPHVAEAMRKERVMRWVVPALTGAVLAVNVWMGEQQRPSKVARGLMRRVVG